MGFTPKVPFSLSILSLDGSWFRLSKIVFLSPFKKMLALLQYRKGHQKGPWFEVTPVPPILLTYRNANGRFQNTLIIRGFDTGNSARVPTDPIKYSFVILWVRWFGSCGFGICLNKDFMLFFLSSPESTISFDQFSPRGAQNAAITVRVWVSYTPRSQFEFGKLDSARLWDSHAICFI